MNRLIKTAKSIPFYIGIILITFIVREQYPFSLYPMYNSFPNYGYLFFFEGEEDVTLTPYMKINHADVSHLYVAEAEKANIQHGYALESEEELKHIGKNIIDVTFDMEELKENHINEISLYRVNIRLENKEIITDTLILYQLNLDEK